MPERLITDHYVAALAMIAAIWGGVVSYSRRILSGERYSTFAAGAHILTAGFAGLLAALACLHADVPVYLAGIISGIAGHMGAEFIKILELRFIKNLNPCCLQRVPAPRAPAHDFSAA